MDLFGPGPRDALPMKLDFHQSDPREPQKYCLFVALLPSPEDAQRFADLGRHLRDSNRLTGKLLEAERLHITLHALANFEGEVPSLVVEAARAASGRVTHAPLKVSFDSAATHLPSNACVLQCAPDSSKAIAQLRSLLAMEFRRTGLKPRPSPTPHMTLLYDRRVVPSQSIDPVDWIAKRLVLVLSHVGLHHHQHLAEYELAG